MLHSQPVHETGGTSRADAQSANTPGEGRSHPTRQPQPSPPVPGPASVRADASNEPASDEEPASGHVLASGGAPGTAPHGHMLRSQMEGTIRAVTSDSTDPSLVRLRSDVRSGNGFVIAGAGVSKSLCPDAPSWVELVRDGVERCASHAGLRNDEWRRIVGELAAANQDKPHGGDLFLASAQLVARGLDAPGGVFAEWLRETFERLPVEDGALAKAVFDLDLAVATVNYDDLLERAVGKRSTLWSDAAGRQAVVQRRSDSVLHLHGLWSAPSSVVFGTDEYARIRFDDGFQAFLDGLFVLKSPIFLGCAGTLADPNFFGVLERQRSKYRTAPHLRCFVLTRNAEVDHFRTLYPTSDGFYVVGYGDTYAELAPFLNRIPYPEEDRPRVAVSTSGDLSTVSTLAFLFDDGHSETRTVTKSGDFVVPLSGSGPRRLSKIHVTTRLRTFSWDLTAGELPAGLGFHRVSTAIDPKTEAVFAPDVPRFVEGEREGTKALLLEPAAVNHLSDSEHPTTQRVVLEPGQYVLWVEGKGSAEVWRVEYRPGQELAVPVEVESLGGATDGASAVFVLNRREMIAVRVSGSLHRFQLEAGDRPTSYIRTEEEVIVTRASDSLFFKLD